MVESLVEAIKNQVCPLQYYFISIQKALADKLASFA